MFKTLIISAATVAFLVTAHAQTIAKWTFETSGPAYGVAVNATSITGITPEEGSGTASALHAATTAWTSPAGNGSAESLSANTWGLGDYWQFQVSTVGYSKIGVSFDQTSSGTGPRDFSLQYSTDGTTFSTFANYGVLVNTSPISWSSTPANYHPEHFFSFDLSGVSEIENSSTLYFRLVNTTTVSAAGGTVASGGTDRIDNFTVAVVPEPASTTLLGLGLAGLLIARRRS